MSVLAIPEKEPVAEQPQAPARKKRRVVRGVACCMLALALVAAFLWVAKGKGWKTWLSETLFPGTADVFRVRPYEGEKGVLLNEFVAADVHLPHFGHGVDDQSLQDGGVTLTRVRDGARIEANVNTSGAGDSIVLSPVELLEPGTEYRFDVTSKVRDTKATNFVPFSSTFTTSSIAATEAFPAAFEKVKLDHAEAWYTCVTFGPDGKLYASTADGRIIRWAIRGDGTLGEGQTISSVQSANQGPRLIIGLRFDPKATADDPVLWLTHGLMVPGQMEGLPDFTSKLSRLSGANLEHCQDYVVGLPRAYRDHLCNQIDFGPDGAIYFQQGSNTSTGAPDKKWGMRYERLLTGAMLRVDLAKITAPPLNVQTEGEREGKAYDPYAAGAPVTLYATGIRLGYDTLWHSSGHLYTAVNGSAAGGNVPAYDPNDNANDVKRRTDLALAGPYSAPPVAALKDIAARPDFLFRIERGAYYGHPNVRRGEFVLEGGNPTAGVDVAEVAEYPVGTQPDRNWHPPALDFGKNVSPNGMIEYASDAFGGALKGKILVVRYSGGDDIVALNVGPSGEITDLTIGIDGLRQFQDPLDLCQDPATGRIYVAEYKGQKLTLVRPRPNHPDGSPAISQHAFRVKVSQETRQIVR
jgi:glucose/arabinose dehydrogenase